MSYISDLLRKISHLPDCRVLPLQGTPKVEEPYSLPNDLREFYSLCGGVELFMTQDYPYTIVPPNEFTRANPVIIGELWPDWEDDISSAWFIIAKDPEHQYLSIDLDPSRFGRCYDSFTGRHANPGDCPIIAFSFSDLLQRLVDNGGSYPYWLEEVFDDMGDAYDNV